MRALAARVPGRSLPFGPFLPRHPQARQYGHEDEDSESKSKPRMMEMSREARMEKPSDEQSFKNIERCGRQAGIGTVSNKVKQNVRYQRVRQPRADQRSQSKGGRAATQYADYADKAGDQQSDGQGNRKNPKTPPVGNIQPDDRTEITPKRRSRAFPFLIGVKQRNSEIGHQNEQGVVLVKCG